MKSETAFVVQVYRDVGRGMLKPDLPFHVASAGSAKMRAEMIAPHVAGVVAYRMRGNLDGDMRRETLVQYGRRLEQTV